MARYTGPDCKRCRREKTKLFLKGSKCDGPKCPIEIRPYPCSTSSMRRHQIVGAEDWRQHQMLIAQRPSLTEEGR